MRPFAFMASSVSFANDIAYVSASTGNNGTGVVGAGSIIALIAAGYNVLTN